VLEKLPCSSGFLINHCFRDRKPFGALPLEECCWSSHATLAPGWAPDQRCWSWYLELPHGVGLSTAASLVQTATKKPDLTIK